MNACPACSYEVWNGLSLSSPPYSPPAQLEDEPELTFRRMYAIDGNDSLKRIARVGTREIGDTRCFSDSDYYIPSEEVDQWAGEVGSGSSREEDLEDDPSDDGEEQEHTNAESPDEGPCANNWKAAQSDSKKRMWGVFAETGLFASACRHGFFLWVADMIRSGEQYVPHKFDTSSFPNLSLSSLVDPNTPWQSQPEHSILLVPASSRDTTSAVSSRRLSHPAPLEQDSESQSPVAVSTPSMVTLIISRARPRTTQMSLKGWALKTLKPWSGFSVPQIKLPQSQDIRQLTTNASSLTCSSNSGTRINIKTWHRRFSTTTGKHYRSLMLRVLPSRRPHAH